MLVLSSQGKQDPEFVKKPDLALNLIEKCLNRGHRPKIVLIDSSYGNNRHFVQQLEAKKLKYIVGVAKNRRIFLASDSGEAKVKALVRRGRQVPEARGFY